MFADLLDHLRHLVAHHGGVGVLGGDDGEVRALTGLDDEEQAAVELRHRVPYAAGSVTELDGRALRERLHARADRGQLVGLVEGEVLGPAELEPVAGQGQGVPRSGGLLQQPLQEPGEAGVCGLHDE